MSSLIVERYIYDALNARASIANAADESRRQLAFGIIRDIELYCADHMNEVFEARARLQSRTDAEASEMLAYIELMLASFANADRVARAALTKARHG